MQNQYLFFRGVTWFIAIFHVIFGIVLNGPIKLLVWFVTHVFGATSMPDASALFLARSLGTYSLVFGIALGIAAWNPIKNRALLSVGAILVGLRAIQRLIQTSDLEKLLGITPEKNFTFIAILFLLAAILIIYRLKLLKDMKSLSPEEKSLI